MYLIVDQHLRSKYPNMRIGVVVAKQVNNSNYHAELENVCSQVFNSFSNRYSDSKDLEAEKNIIIWRDVYKSFGANPKKKTPTAESLLSRVIKSHFVPHINPAVDCYLMAETIHCLPIGGYDTSKIDGDIFLRFSQKTDTFIGIGSDETEHLEDGEVIYSDASRVLTRRWNYKDCDYSKIDGNTQALALFVEAPTESVKDDEVMDTTQAIANNLALYCGAVAKTLLLSANSDRIEIA